MESEDQEALVRRSFAAYLAGDREAIEAILHPSFTFTSPYDDHIGRDGYFERCWANAGSFEQIDVQHVTGHRDGCFVLYEG